jgi:hypothetical protein
MVNDEMIIKVSHIGVINMLEKAIGKSVSSFKELEKYTLTNLEELRDNLVVEYNEVIESRKFAGEMIYDRKPENHKSEPLKSQSDYDNKENMEELVSLDTDKMYFVNKDDWIEKFWKNNYHVWMTAQGIQFCVNADSTGDALDEIMDYCVEHKLEGLYTTHEDKNWEEEEYMVAGNYGYQFTTHNIRIELVD